MDILAGREIIVEVKAAGAYAQVCAIDCATGVEVFVTTPVNASRNDQQSLALRKLAKALTQDDSVNAGANYQEKSGNLSRLPPSPKRGFLA